MSAEELLVKLGLETDAQSFKNANNEFTNLETTAIKTGLAIGVAFAGVAAALAKISADTANARGDLGLWAEGANVSIKAIEKLRHAVAGLGGTEADAMAIYEKINTLRDQVYKGETPDWMHESDQFDAAPIQGMDNEQTFHYVMESLSNIQDPDVQRRVAGQAGFSSPVELGVMTNSGRTLSEFKEAEAFGVASQKLIEQSADYVDAMAETELAMRSFKDMIAGEVLPGMTEWMKAVNSWTAEHKDGMQKTIEFLGGIDRDTRAKDVAKLFGDDDVRDLGGWLGSAISDWAKDVKDLQPNMILTRELQDWWGSRNEDEESDPANDQSNYTPLKAPNKQDDYAPFMGPSYAPDFSSFTQGNVTHQTNVTANVDARGSTDPAATEAAVERGVYRVVGQMADRAKDDFPNDER